MALGRRALVISMPDDLRVPDPHNRWGHEPFHFVEEYHDYLALHPCAAIASIAPARV